MIKFSELVKECENVGIDCDRCKYQKECAKVAEHLDGASPIMIAAMVQEDHEF